ncbi:putative reverse transcriptase domain-containing protein [Tanacetum coccineum]
MIARAVSRDPEDSETEAQMIEIHRTAGPAKDPAEPDLPEEPTLTTTTSFTMPELPGHDLTMLSMLFYQATAATRNGDDSHTSGTVQEGMNALCGIIAQWENQVKFCHLYSNGTALHWWNSHARTVTNDVAYAMTDGTDVVVLQPTIPGARSLLSEGDRIFPEELTKLKEYEAIEMATELMDRRINTFAERQAESKRKFEDTPRNNQTQQQNKRQNTGRAYAAGNGDKKPYEGTKPLCTKPLQEVCPQWKNKNQGNGNAVARAYAVGVAGQNPDNNVVTGTFLLNNRCASILFDTGADRSFVSTQFSTLINIAPTTLDHGYNVELADGRIIWVNTILLGCTLNFLNHPFHVDLMPVEMGTYDVIIGMDWLTKYQAIIERNLNFSWRRK